MKKYKKTSKDKNLEVLEDDNQDVVYKQLITER